MTQKERMEKGLVYYCGDEEIMGDQVLCLEKLYDYNQSRPLEGEKRIKIISGEAKNLKVRSVYDIK